MILTEEQQNRCVAFILAMAFNGADGDMVGLIQASAKKFLSELPPEILAKAAGTPIDFTPK